MGTKLTIGEVSRRLGVPAKIIRFYEAQGVISSPARTAAGYRVYTTTDIRRLRLARRARLLGLSLAEVKAFVEEAFASECGEFGRQILRRIVAQRAEIDRRMSELRASRSELDELERHFRHDRANTLPGQRIIECGFCPLIDEEGGESQ